MFPLCLIFLVAYFVLDAAHAPVMALTCLAFSLFLLPPVRGLVILCLAAVMRLLVAGVEALIRICPTRPRGFGRTPPIYLPPRTLPPPTTPPQGRLP